MAAPVGKMRRVSDDSSSSDEEVLRRCQEAVWDSGPAGRKDGGGGDAPQSRRVVVAEHEHDGNELQVTQGFRTHVAKKLETLLNSCISETHVQATPCADVFGGGEEDDGEEEEEEEEDGGFRLFSTSVPGQRAEETPAAARRWPAPSSSDSDSEMEQRLREAAVSVTDLLPAVERHGQEVMDGRADAVGEQEERKKKKKKRRKVAQRCAGSPAEDAQRNGENRILDLKVEEDEEVGQVQEEAGLKVKQKKKKRKVALGDEGSPTVDAQRNGNDRSLDQDQEEEGEGEWAGSNVKQKKKKKRKEAATVN